jgi:hypothetical protein
MFDEEAGHQAGQIESSSIIDQVIVNAERPATVPAPP